MNLQSATDMVRSSLLEYGLKMAFNDKPVQICDTFIEPMIIFLSMQNHGVPIGALLGHLIGSRQDRIEEGITFIEACVEQDLIDIDCVNGNWIVLPITIEYEICEPLGVSSTIIPKNNRNAFCGKVIHKPIPTRVDHLEQLNQIRFTLNREFISAFPKCPNNAPYKNTIPYIIDNAFTSFRLDHNFDTRGRFYCGSHLNYQGTEWEKCLLKFSKELKITEEGYNSIREYISNLKDDEQYLKYTAQLALDSEYTGIFIGTDARASGIQILSVLTGCEVSARHVGLLDKNNDPYQIAADNAGFDFSNSGWFDPKTKTIDRNVNPRDLFKPACMQHFYGGKKTPKLLLGEGNYEKFVDTLFNYFPGCSIAKEEIEDAYWNTPVFKWELPDGFQVQQAVMRTERIELAFNNDPKITFGFAYKSLKGKDEGLELPANLVHSVDGYVARELIYRAKLGGEFINEIALKNAIKKAGHHDNPNETFCLYKLMQTPLDKWALLGKSFLQKAWDYLQACKGMPSFEVIAVHDDFKTHPNFINWVKFLYIEILADIADSNLFQDIVRQINPKAYHVRYEPTPSLAKAIRQAYKDGIGGGLF